MVDALESTGLLCRVPCADDRRRYDLTLTDQGRAKLAQIRELIPGYEDEVTCKLRPEERRQLHALLNKMNDV
jgi:DNA-binding MarR family transcriptional regulator